MVVVKWDKMEKVRKAQRVSNTRGGGGARVTVRSRSSDSANFGQRKTTKSISQTAEYLHRHPNTDTDTTTQPA
jgi:hypothetical protein